MKWNSEVVGDAAEHVLFSNRKPPNLGLGGQGKLLTPANLRTHSLGKI
jgi:hypothetical protein